MEKIWIKVKGHNTYVINNYGEIKSIKRNALLKHRITEKGYHTVLLYYDCGKKYKSYRVHRLVLSSFDNVDYTTHPLECNHKDEDKSNNRLDNLCWLTRKENMNWNGLSSRINRKNRKITEKFRLAIKEKLSKKIQRRDIKTGEILDYKSIADAKREGFSAGNISACCRGVRKKHMGYEWKFI